MIRGEYAVIRVAEPDDANELMRVYDPARPRSSLLDRRREILIPTVDELRELLIQKDKLAGRLYTIEDPKGFVRGSCALRSAQPEMAYAELALILFDDEDYKTPLAKEALDFLLEKAFTERKLNKVLTQCLDSEGAYRDFLVRQGFTSDGVQREVLFTQGRWHDMETFSLFRAAAVEG